MKRYFANASETVNNEDEGDAAPTLVESTSEQTKNANEVEENVDIPKFRRTTYPRRNRNFDEDFDRFPDDIDSKLLKKYQRKDVKLDGLTTKFQQDKFLNRKKQYEYSVRQTARAEVLLPEEAGYVEADEGESTCWITQKEIADSVDITSATKYFDLDLKKFGPYRTNYTKNGRFLLLGGRMGHLAAFDWLTKHLEFEINVMEQIKDVQWLHNETMLAAAQKRYTYLYDNQGTELHCLKMLHNIIRLEFLPYHFLLVAASSSSFINWVDVSVGKLVAAFPTKVGPLDVMCQNPSNAIIHCGQSRGVVSLWSPNVKEAVAKLSCHFCPVRGLSVENSGIYMATSASDKSLKIWDLRQMKREVFDYKLNRSAEPIIFSQRRSLACGLGTKVNIFKDVCAQESTQPYLTHSVGEMITDLQFCPYEDVLGVGHSGGFSSLLVPGAGEPNIDAYEGNPFQSKRQRREGEVKALLDKIQPEMITLDAAMIGRVDPESAAADDLKNKLKFLTKTRPGDGEKINLKRKAKGKSGGAQRFKRKSLMQYDQKYEFLKAQKTIRSELTKKGILAGKGEKDDKSKIDGATSVLDRFVKKSAD